MSTVQTSGLDGAKGHLCPTGPAFDQYAFKAHPLLPMPSAEELAQDMADPERRPEVLKFLTARSKRLRLAEESPLFHRLRLPQSREIDALLEKYQLVYESGGKRAGKTEDGVPRFLECCFAYGPAKRWAMQDNALSSIANLQQTFWKYLPPSVKALNQKRGKAATRLHRVHYTPDGGFDGVLILPNGCAIYFLNYTQQPSDFLGWELGKGLEVPLRPGIADIGALLDENCSLPWLENIQLRCSTRGSKIHWMYSPQDGITPTIRDLKANVRTTQSTAAELLREKVNVPGLPRGEMPVVQVDEKKRLAIYYRFTQHNPFSGYDRPGGVKELCQGKNNEDYTKRHAYGYCDAVRGRAFPLFGEINVVKPEAVPAEGTNYQVVDPHGAKNWYTLYARACPGRPGNLYIYREWPDWDNFGEWAKTSANPKKLNGERGSAQPTIGYGPTQYKQLYNRLEKIHVPAALRAMAQMTNDGGSATGDVWFTEEEWNELLKSVTDPHHRKMIRKAVAAGEDLDELREPIFQRLIDPRAGHKRTEVEQGAVDLTVKLAREDRDGNQQILAGPMYFTAAPGLDLRDGISQANEFLFYKPEEEVVSILNEPRLYVSERCRNFIWAMNNYCLPTDSLTSDDACEEPVDCLRYLVTAGVRYVIPGGKVKTTGGGTY